jgi:predicted secreted protein
VTLTVAGSCGSNTKKLSIDASVFNRTFGGTGNDAALSVQPTSDGGYILAGYRTNCSNNHDVLLIKTDAGGDASAGHGWQKTFGGTGDDMACSVQQTRDGGYIVAGYTSGSITFGSTNDPIVGCVGSYHALLIKTDAVGTAIWGITLGSTGQDKVYSVRQTDDGGYILAGTTKNAAGGYDAWLVKVSAGGTETWEKTYNGLGDDAAYSVVQTTDGGYMLVCSTTDGIIHDLWMIKTDGDGNLIWDKTFSSTDSEWPPSMQQTADGGYILAGSTYSADGIHIDALLIKTDANGDTGSGKGWTKTFTVSGYDYADSVQQTSDGGYILAGATYSNDPANTDAYLIKTDADGNQVWDKIFGGSGDDAAFCVRQTPDNGYIMAGYTSSYGAGGYDVWIIKTDANGDAPLTP